MAQSRTRSPLADGDNFRVGAPRIQDVARRAGVAIGTVSNVLNKPDLVSERTRLKVEAAIAELGFVRNSAARALAADRTDTVGLVLYRHRELALRRYCARGLVGGTPTSPFAL